MRVMVGMSGGVDSSVAAARVVAAGHEAVGVHYAFGEPNPAHVGDARAVAERLGIDFQVWDFADEFRAQVMDYFVGGYADGRTPNPCVRCNRTMKFGSVLERGLAEGFDAVATGHYARLVDGPEGRTLRRAVDHGKDQSYVLAVLTPEQLARCLFPLGDSTKAEVRAEAAELGLLTAHKPDSLDICFIPDGDTAGFLSRRIGERPGVVVDTEGEVVGTHAGAHQFTVGQRKGLRLGRPAADGRPRYVVATSASDNTVTVGPRERLAVRTLHCGPATWTTASPSGPIEADVQVRAHGAVTPATITPGDGTTVTFAQDVLGVAAGQQAVFYAGDVALGSALIESVA